MICFFFQHYWIMIMNILQLISQSQSTITQTTLEPTTSWNICSPKVIGSNTLIPHTPILDTHSNKGCYSHRSELKATHKTKLNQNIVPLLLSYDNKNTKSNITVTVKGFEPTVSRQERDFSMSCNLTTEPHRHILTVVGLYTITVFFLGLITFKNLYFGMTIADSVDPLLFTPMLPLIWRLWVQILYLGWWTQVNFTTHLSVIIVKFCVKYMDVHRLVWFIP